MKGISFLLCCILCSCYNNRGSNPTHDVILNTQLLSRYTEKEQKTIILSCLSCGCIQPILRDLTAADIQILSGFRIIGDSNCFKTKLPLFHLQQRVIDSLSEDIYNITLVKKIDEKYKVRIIETIESDRLISICQDFFKD